MRTPDSFFERTVFLVSVLAVCLLVFPSGAEADYLLRFNERQLSTGPDRGKSSAPRQVWASKTCLRFDYGGGDSCAVVCVDTKKVYIINHRRKVYFETDYPFNFNEGPVPEEFKESRRTLEDMGISKKILGMEAKLYRYRIVLKNGLVYGEVDLWSVENAPEELLLLDKASLQTGDVDPFGRFINDGIRKLHGFTIKAETRGTMGDADREFTSIEKKDPPPGIYEVPKGYVSVPLGKE